VSKARFSLAYWAPVDYYASLLKFDSICFEQWESFPKQSYRNRCYIDSPNGKLMLNFPVDHSSKKQIKDTRLSTKEKWQQKHWQALISSYGNSPFFDAIAPEIELFYQKDWQFLIDLNLACHELIGKCLRLSNDFYLSSSWQIEDQNELDLREKFHPKKDSQTDFTAYPQVFDHKHGFLKNLSVLDLIFNEGPASYDYLQQL